MQKLHVYFVQIVIYTLLIILNLTVNTIVKRIITAFKSGRMHIICANQKLSVYVTILTQEVVFRKY